MTKFSDRYGYTQPCEVLIRERLDIASIKALCNCFDYLEQWLDDLDLGEGRTSTYGYHSSYTFLEEYIWCFYLNELRRDFWVEDGHRMVLIPLIMSHDTPWYEIFNVVECSLKYLSFSSKKRPSLSEIISKLRRILNQTFTRLNLAYRVVNDHVLEITDKEEIIAIEEALCVSTPVRTHLSAAMEQLSRRPHPDYRNSIKESISAVEAICREMTGKNTLGDSLSELEKKNVVIPRQLKSAFEKMYIYTNDKETGIRHALMEDLQCPGFDEAKFMLVACSAFTNYLSSKIGV